MRKKKYKESNLFGCSTHWKLEFRFAHVQHWNKFPRLAFAYPITDNINNNNKTFHCCFFCLGCVLLNAFHMLWGVFSFVSSLSRSATFSGCVRIVAVKLNRININRNSRQLNDGTFQTKESPMILSHTSHRPDRNLVFLEIVSH